MSPTPTQSNFLTYTDELTMSKLATSANEENI